MKLLWKLFWIALFVEMSVMEAQKGFRIPRYEDEENEQKLRTNPVAEPPKFTSPPFDDEHFLNQQKPQMDSSSPSSKAGRSSIFSFLRYGPTKHADSNPVAKHPKFTTPPFDDENFLNQQKPQMDSSNPWKKTNSGSIFPFSRDGRSTNIENKAPVILAKTLNRVEKVKLPTATPRPHRELYTLYFSDDRSNVFQNLLLKLVVKIGLPCAVAIGLICCCCCGKSKSKGTTETVIIPLPMNVQCLEQPSVYPGQSNPCPEQPSVYPGQSNLCPGQPSACPGQPNLCPGQPNLCPGQPNPCPGQPSACPGQPSAYPGQPSLYPQ